jgi:hypothetical protein
MATAPAKKTAKKAAPAKKAAAPAPAAEAATDEVVFGVSDIAAHLTKKHKLEKPVTTRELRTLIRKMAREDNARVTREIIPGNRTRYSWSGLNDPEVKAIIAAYDSGELEADKKEKLQALKDRKAAAKAEAAEAEGTDEDEAGEDEAEEDLELDEE